MRTSRHGVAFRADAAFGKPEIYEALETRGVAYAIRIPANKHLELAIEDLLFRLPGRPSLQQGLVKTGGRLVKHSRYYWRLLAESHLTRRLFGSMLQRIWALPVPAGQPNGGPPDPSERRGGVRAIATGTCGLSSGGAGGHSRRR
jgi:hypothetical protein